MGIKIERTVDAEVVARLNEPVQRLHHERYPEYFKEYSFEAALGFFRERLRQETWKCLVASEDDRPVGYVLFFEREYGENPFRRAYKGIQIDQICIDEDKRRRGIGAMLMGEVEKYARTVGASQLELTYWEKNVEAHAFYEKQGFARNMNFVARRLDS